MSDWQRLDPRVLLIGPVEAARQLVVPAVIAMVGIGSQQPRALLLLTPLFVIGAVVLGVIPWLTTRFRIEDERLLVHTGLLNRKQLTAPIERVRSVDLEATVLHRLLSLRKVLVGTGVDDGRIELDSLSVAQAQDLRERLLGSRPAAVPATAEDGLDASSVGLHESTALPAAPAPVVLARLDPRWARFAPFSLARLAVVAGLVGAIWQFDLPVEETGQDVWNWAVQASIWLVGIGLALALISLWCVGSALSYLVSWWDLRLAREHGNLTLTRGLFTTTSTTVEEDRIRGVELQEPVLLRMVRGAELKSLVTGLDEGVYPVLPQCPVAFARDVGSQVLDDGGAGLSVPLAQHGRFARRRGHVRAQWMTTGWLLPLAVAGVLADVIGAGWAVVAALMGAGLGVLVGEMSYAHLGHALTGTHLVVGRGALTRIRTVLARRGVIGWTMRQSLFQRRHDLVTLTATTAAGNEFVALRDVDRAIAVALIREVSPTLGRWDLAAAVSSRR